MAAISLATSNKINVATSGPVFQVTAPAAEGITAGAPIVFNSSGQWVNADADGAGLKACVAIATRTGSNGSSITGVMQGIVEGYDLTSVAFGAPVYLSATAGGLDTATGGGGSVRAGICIPIWSQALGGTPNKALYVSGVGADVIIS